MSSYQYNKQNSHAHHIYNDESIVMRYHSLCSLFITILQTYIYKDFVSCSFGVLKWLLESLGGTLVILHWFFLDSSVFDTKYLLTGTSIGVRSSLTGLSGVLQISVFFHWGGKFFHWVGNSNEKQKHNNLAHIRRRKGFCCLSKYISLVKPGHFIKHKNKT